MRLQALCAGTGGQGVIWLARVLGEAAARRSVPVLSAETHGMAMRGGSVVCHVKLGPFASPLVLAGRADLLLALDAAEAERYRHFLRPGGRAVVNGPPSGEPGRVDAAAAARAAGAPRALNAALLGFADGLGAVALDPAALRDAVAAVSPPEHREASLAAFEAGRAAAARRGGG